MKKLRRIFRRAGSSLFFTWAGAFVVLSGVLFAVKALAAWDPAKPPTSGALVSADIRANWTATGQTVGAVNMVADNQFFVWVAGDSAAPTYWSLTGAGAAIARTGTGLGDTTRKFGPYAAKITAGGAATALLDQRMLTSNSYDDGMDEREVSAGAWFYCTSSSAGLLNLYDGDGTSSSGYATANVWTWLTVTRTIDADATEFRVRHAVLATKVCYVSGTTVIAGPVYPLYPVWSDWERQTFKCSLTGTATTGTDKPSCNFNPSRPGFVTDVQLRAKTAPTGQALIVDVNTWDGAAFTSMFSTRPQIAAAASRGGAAPDTTYARKCFTGQAGASLATGGEISVDVDQIGSGTAGADLEIYVRALVAHRPQEGMLVYSEFN